jgi:hypothetical protein
MLRLYYYTMTAPIEVIAMGDVDIRKLPITHREVYSRKMDVQEYLMKYKFLSGMFRTFNDDESNPLTSEKSQRYISNNQLHTSMSVGDVVCIQTTNSKEYWACKPMGWEQVQ